MLSCNAVIENKAQRDNLCDCIRILGGVPEVNKDTVSIDYDGPQTTRDKFIELFEQYPRHGISIIGEK